MNHFRGDTTHKQKTKTTIQHNIFQTTTHLTLPKRPQLQLLRSEL